MFTFYVTPDSGETYRVVAASRDVLTWEKGLKGRSFGDLANSPSMSGMYGLAYAASRRQGLYGGSLQDFEQSVDLALVADEEAGQPDPTPPGAGPGPLLGSPSQPASRQASGRTKTNAR